MDIGTTAVKAIAVDRRGHVCERARVPHPVHIAGPDSFEHDAAVAWWDGPLKAVAMLGRSTQPCVGLGIAACVPSLVALDSDLRPLTRGLVYGDSRGRSVAAPNPPRTPLDVHEGRAFLGWMARRWPDARAYWPAQALAAAAFGGAPVIDLFAAMSFFPVFDGVRWDPAELDTLGIAEDQLPRVVPEVGAWAGELAAGGPAGNQAPAVLVAGGVDVVAEQIIAGLAKPGDVHVICGTTLVTWAVVADDNKDVPGLWRIPHPRPGLCFLGGPSNVGGLFINWVRRLVGTCALTSPDYPDRVPVWIPYVRGERTPFHDSSLRASVHGLDLTHDAAALLRAAYESVGFVIRRQLDLAGCTPSRIVVTGGGVRDSAWMQAIADCTGAMVTRSAIPEGSALGMAWLARMAAGLESSADAAPVWFQTREPLCPDERWRADCERRYMQFCELLTSRNGRLMGRPG